MALEPEDRYSSARALADDLEHWLADESITALCDPVLTRMARWGRRHKTLAHVWGDVTQTPTAQGPNFRLVTT